ncbi:MAG: PBP1A family penicillin-binding protein, partial [bacterium]
MAKRRRRGKAQKAQQTQTRRRLRGVGTSRAPRGPGPRGGEERDAAPAGFVRRFIRFSLAFIFLLVVVGAVGAAGVGIYYYQEVASKLPNVNLLRSHKPSLVTRVFDQSGNLLREYYVERRFLITLNEVPDTVIQAILATEDARFEEHPGVDLVGIFRAAVKNLLGGQVLQGGSTITQQLAKSLFLSPKRSYDRKIREAILAVRIERTFSKREILNLYLNQIYFGQGAYGIEAASRVYFGKNAAALNLAEAALLAGLPRAPSAYSPVRYYQRALRRRAHVLRRMIDEGYITPEEWAEAEVSPIRLTKKLRGLGNVDYAVEYVRRKLVKRFGTAQLYRGGLKVHSTLRRGMQRDINLAVRKGISEVDRRRGYRGPLGTVDLRWSDERMWRMVPKLMGELRNRREIRTGRWMPAIVEQLKPESATLRVKRGEAVLLLENAEWARPFDPRKNGTGLKLDDFSHILRRGDVILVERLERERLNEGIRTGPFQVALVQEPDVQAAAVVIEPSTGAIRAMAGGYDFERSQFNRAYQAVRPPGSAFKPVVYSAAFSEGWTPSDIMMDTPIIFPRNGPRGLWKPTNFEEKFYGPTTLRDALTHSRNVVTVKLANSVGISKVVRRARQFGIRSPLQPNLSLALGSSGVTLLELTSLYGTLANKGRRVEPHVIDFVENSDGATIWGATPTVAQSVPPEEAYVILSLLRNVIRSGTGAKARALGRPLAGKTGTTNDFQDAWFV